MITKKKLPTFLKKKNTFILHNINLEFTEIFENITSAYYIKKAVV